MPKRTHDDALQTKDRVLRAALEIFSRQGYEKTTLTDIAREAGVTRGAIYWHFEDKGELLCELCKLIAKDNGLSENLLAAASDTEKDPLGQLKTWALNHTTEKALRFFSSAIINEIDSVVRSTSGDERVRERLIELMDSRLFLVREALRRAVAERQLPINFDVELGAQFLLVALWGVCDMHTTTNAVARQALNELTSQSQRIIEITFRSLALCVRDGSFPEKPAFGRYSLR